MATHTLNVVVSQSIKNLKNDQEKVETIRQAIDAIRFKKDILVILCTEFYETFTEKEPRESVFADISTNRSLYKP